MRFTLRRSSRPRPRAGGASRPGTALPPPAIAESDKPVAVQEAPSASTISAPGSVCSGSSGNTASVSPRTGITHTWSISGGTITSPATGESVTFTAGASGSLTLTVTATDSCGTGTPSSKQISVTPSPTATLSGSTTIVRGGAPATLSVALTGSSPWRLEWPDGHIEPSVTNASHKRSVAPPASTTYTLTVTSGGCTRAGSGSAVVTVIPAPPASVTAMTQENRNVLVTWPAVSGASGYWVERTTRVGAATSFVVTTTATSYADVVPASAGPVTYIYYVRTVDTYGEVSERGPWDHATAATVLYAQPQLVPGGTLIAAVQVNELRRGIDALRHAVSVPAAFGGATLQPGDVVRAADFTSLVSALNGAFAAIGTPPFAYSGIPAPAPGGTVFAGHMQQLREALR